MHTGHLKVCTNCGPAGLCTSVAAAGVGASSPEGIVRLASVPVWNSSVFQLYGRGAVLPNGGGCSGERWACRLNLVPQNRQKLISNVFSFPQF